MRVKNVSPLGDLDVPGVGTVAAGKSVVVSEKVGARLLEQPANWVAEKEKAE